MTADLRAPAPGERGSLWLWAGSTTIAAIGLLVYLPLSRIPALRAVAEDPGFSTLLVVLAAAFSVALSLRLARRGVRAARTSLLAGSLAAVLGAGAHAVYLHGMSRTMAPAVAAPAVGDAARGFTIRDPEGRTFDLTAQRGAPVLLVFFRAHW